MEQQRLTFTGKAHVVAWKQVEWRVSLPRKEEPLVHSRQVGNTCAYHALAMLIGRPPQEVLAMGQSVLKESRLRKFCGKHDLLIETYRRLGYKFPWKQVSHAAPQKVKSLESFELSGSGFLRLTHRYNSRSGHLAAFKAGTVYDSNLSSSSEFEEYKSYSLKRGVYYVRIIPVEMIEREDNELSNREIAAQHYLKKRPRYTRRRRSVCHPW